MKHFSNNAKEYLKMTEEDYKFRQGRSKRQYENNAKIGMTASFLLPVPCAVLVITGRMCSSEPPVTSAKLRTPAPSV